MSEDRTISTEGNSQIVQAQAQSYGAISENMAESLIKASPWIRFLAIISFINTGFFLLAGIGILVALPFLKNFFYGMGEVLIVYVPLGIMYIILAIVLFFPAFFTWNFGANLKNWQESNKGEDLENAFKYNATLWKFNGILTIVMLSVMVLGILIGIVGGIAAMSAFI